MINVIITTAIVASAGIFCSEERETIIDFKDLPAKSQTFIENYFDVGEISYIIKEEEFTSTSYLVKFRDGNEIEFIGNGDWDEIECEYSPEGVPTKIIPQKILETVNKRFPSETIVNIKKEIYGRYEIELKNGLEITFNDRFEIIRLDD